MLYSTATAQLTSPENKAKPYVPTWEVYEFMKYGTIGASLYTGTVNYSIPIYSYKDEDFDYGISIDYATNGFRVNHSSGSLGHGWSLSSPGMITREIHGLADECVRTIIAPGGNGCQLYGYEKTPVGNFIGELLVDGNNQGYTAVTDGKGAYYDAQPDIYRFNFCGYSGSFRLLPYRINESQYVFFDCSSNSQSLKIKNFTDKSTIVILDGKGYKYTFSVGEYTKEKLSDAVGAIPVKIYRQWNLQKITAPNGRMIEFQYLPILDNDGLDKSNHNISYTPSLSYEHVYYKGVSNSYGSKSITVSANDVYSTQLTGIIFPDKTRLYIDYIDGVTEKRYISPNGNVSETFGNNKKINVINIYSPENKLFKKASFSYNILGGQNAMDNRLTFLESVSISGQGKFSFEYNSMTAYPLLGTIKSDHWGYYNGESGGFDVNDFFSNVYYDDKYNENYYSPSKKNPNYEASLSGTLCKIIYPTGGYSTIGYEQHDCSQKVIRNSNTNFLPKFETLLSNEKVGGVRIKQVVNYLSDGAPEDTLRYEYNSTDDKNLSSGILINVPRYGIKYRTDGKIVDRYNLSNSIYDFGKTHIEYSHVREYKSSSGYTDYYYNSYNNYPDEYQLQEDEDKDHRLYMFNFISDGSDNKRVTFMNPSYLVTNILTPIPSAQIKRGLLSKVKKYKTDGTLIKKTTYNYDFPLVKMDTVLTLAGEMAHDVFYPRYNIELYSVDESVYVNNKYVSDKKISTFNSLGQEVETKQITADGNLIVDTYQYSGDKSYTGGIYKEMRLANNVNSLILHEKKILIDGQEFAINKDRYNYYSPNSTQLFKVSSIETWSPNSGWTTKETYDYDDIGRVKQQTDSCGIYSSYLWGYNGRYPLAIVDNLPSGALEKSLTARGVLISDLSNGIISDETFGKLSAICSLQPQSLFNILKFKSNYGLTKLISPNTTNTVYNYDGYGRLKSITDSKDQVLQQGFYKLMSILPISATISCPDTYVDENINATVYAKGGSNTYDYTFKIYNSQSSNLVYNENNSNGVLNISPYEKGMAIGKYRISCEAYDIISEEKVLLNKDFIIKPVRLRFSDIVDTDTGVIHATIYTDTQTEVTFSLELVSTEPCTITIAGVSHSFTMEKEATFKIPLSVGNNQVSIVYPRTAAVFDATLCMVEATNGHELDNPAYIYISY